jgi:integrase
MTAWAKQYLDHRRKLGYRLRIEGQQLLQFACWADRADHCGPVTIDLAVRWATLPKGRAPLYWARRLEVIRGLARYQAIFDPDTQIPPTRLLGPAHRRTTPYIYSEEEIAQLLASAKAMAPASGLRPRTYYTLFGLLASTGLRISEALTLRRDRVDLGQGVLTIDQSKFCKRRLVPLHPSTTQALRRYARHRNHRHPVAQSDAFFVSDSGRPLPYSTVRNTFKRIRENFDWRPADGVRAPRIHDLRHTFVCRRILQWVADGVDVDHAITTLSTYLGHRKATDTYWYLTGVPELLALAARRFEHGVRKGGLP